MVLWPGCFGPVVMWHTAGQETAHVMVARKQKERKKKRLGS
jgi:hypothetical protein